MTHEYKVGDRVRMLQDCGDLVEGEIYRVESVDRDYEYLPIQVGEHGDWPTVGMFELVTEEEDNTDLLENRIPLGLLDPDVQERMKAWEHGHEHYVAGNVWCSVGKPAWLDDYTYRAKPAPVEPERETRWMNVYEEHIGSVKDSRKDADAWGLDDRIALWRITYDKETGLNPVIEVEGEQDE